MEEVPNLNFFGKFLKNTFPEEDFFSKEAITIVGPNPTLFMHNESGPPPGSFGLECSPKIYTQPICLC